jgi:hypothetical protein
VRFHKSLNLLCDSVEVFGRYVSINRELDHVGVRCLSVFDHNFVLWLEPFSRATRKTARAFVFGTMGDAMQHAALVDLGSS